MNYLFKKSHNSRCQMNRTFHFWNIGDISHHSIYSGMCIQCMWFWLYHIHIHIKWSRFYCFTEIFFAWTLFTVLISFNDALQVFYWINNWTGESWTHSIETFVFAKCKRELCCIFFLVITWTNKKKWFCPRNFNNSLLSTQSLINFK